MSHEEEVASAMQVARTASGARRMAELFEAEENRVQAESWWRYAASLGDEDARLYVEHVYDERGKVAGADRVTAHVMDHAGPVVSRVAEERDR